LLITLGLCGCARPAFYDAAPIEDPALAPCVWTKRFTPPIVYQESDFIRAYFEPADLAAYRQAMPARFSLPPRPMIRVSVLDFYEMANGPLYRESEISLLVLNEGRPGWFVLTMPVTDADACAAGRSALGTPKVMRRVTLERAADRYVGTSYALGGRTAEFTLQLEVREPGEGAREILDFVSPLPEFHLLRGRVVTLGGLPRSALTLARTAPEVWRMRLGEARLEFPRDNRSLLHRLGVGRPLAAYWGRLRYRFSITPR